MPRSTSWPASAMVKQLAWAAAISSARLAPGSAEELIRRFLLHVLPGRFVRIRHFGLLAASNVNTKLAAAREALRHREPVPVAEELGRRERMLRLTGTDPMACPACGNTLM